MPMLLPPLYPITPEGLRGAGIMAWVAELLHAGCQLLQVRRKTGPDGERLTELDEVVARCHAHDCRVIVDDRVDLAMLSGADGVHLGQTDLPPSEARQLLGPHKIIGFSTHTWEQFQEALDYPVDYLALGPVFPTDSKIDPDAVVPGTDQDRILRTSPLPVVAIGGITPNSARELWERGFASLAVIGALAHEPGEGWRDFMSRLPPG
jgi:thiamine-phosphate diphosphorylase